MAKPPAISLPKVADLNIPEGPIDGKTLKDVFTRLLSQNNSFFDQIQKLASKGITFTENFRAEVVTGTFSHGTPQNVALTTLTKAGSALVLSADGQVAYSPPALQMQQTATGRKPLAQVTIFFNNPLATNINCTLLLLPEGSQSSTVPALNPGSQSVVQGNSATYNVLLAAINGFAGTTTLSASGLPSGATASFNPATVTGGGASVLTVTTSAATPVATSTITVTGVSAALSLFHSTTVSLTVTAPTPTPDFTIAGDTSWTNISSFSNGWTNFGSTSAPAAYKKEGNRIWVRGGLHNGTINAVGFNLPANYRPQYDLTFMGVSYSSAAAGAGLICPILVQTNGNVTIGNDANGNNFYAEMNFSFDTLS